MPRPAWLIRSTRMRTVTVYSIAVQADGKVLAGGVFTRQPNRIGGQTRNHIARLESDGRLDQTLDLGIVGSQINTIAVQPDGKVLIGGVFSTVLGVTRNNIARLNADGTLDTAFDPNANGNIYSIAVQKDGKILVGGVFTQHRRSRRATASPGSTPRPERLIRSTRTRTARSIPSRCRRTARFWSAACSQTSAERRATTSPGSTPPPDRPIRSTRTRTVRSIRSRCKRTGRLWRAASSQASADSDAQLHRPARCHDGSGRFIRPEFGNGPSPEPGFMQSWCRRMGRFWCAVGSATSADSRATASPDSMP